MATNRLTGIQGWSDVGRIRDGLATVAAPFLWTWRQVSGLGRSTYDYFADFAVDDVLPPSFRDFANWLIGVLPRAFGVRNTTRREQINANVVLIAVSILSSILTAGATLVLVLFWGILLLFAWFFRGTPAGESLWTRTRRKLPIKRDYDLPLWRSE